MIRFERIFRGSGEDLRVKLIDAFETLNLPIPDDAPNLNVFLACGFTPLHLQTFLAARLRVRMPRRRVRISTGLFGDLTGNIARMDPSNVHALAVAIEWADLDPRLGVRSLGGWRPATLLDIVASAAQSAARLQQGLMRISRLVPTAISMPSLPLPPLFPTQPAQSCFYELQLHQTVMSLAASLCQQPGIRLVNAQLLDETSPPAMRFDVKSEVTTGFPYSLQHSSALTEIFASLIDDRPHKKGMITDLDDTLWAGILGEDGVSGISWQLERGTQMHGLYQQFVASLAGAGVLIAVASKSDPTVVEKAFDRSDLLVSRTDIFPFEVHWSRKSESVRRILDAWNVNADSVVFIDDSPMEVAEVQAMFPEVECIVFPKGDYQSILDLMKYLRGVFGKAILTEEDALRLGSIRNSMAWKASVQPASGSSDEFLRTAEASLIFGLTRECRDDRAFELVNKTNQFNLNGKRYTETEWRSFQADSTSLSLIVSYKDKYGPLGKIAVILGRQHGRRLLVETWVMSCRAFSRRIEHQCLKYLFETLGVDEIAFDYKATPRNSPLQEFLAELLGESPAPGVTLSRKQFFGGVPTLFHRVERTINVSS
jgi:FkbH-like protein